MANYGGYDSGAEDAGLSAADQDPGTAGGDTSEDGAVSEMYSNFAANFNNQTKANGTNPLSKGGFDVTRRKVSTLEQPSIKTSKPRLMSDIVWEGRLKAQQSRQAANVTAMQSELQATEEQQADFKSGKNRGGISSTLGDFVTKGSRIVGMNPIEDRGTLASDYGVNKNVTADPDRIAASREVDWRDDVALGVGVASAFIPPSPTSPVQALAALGRHDARMTAKGVGNPRDIDTTQTMNYGNPSMYGASPTAPSPPEPGEGAPNEFTKATRKPVTRRVTTTNKPDLLVTKPTTPSRATLRGFRRRGYSFT